MFTLIQIHACLTPQTIRSLVVNYRAVIDRFISAGKKAFIFTFESNEALLAFFRNNVKQNIELTTLTWKELDIVMPDLKEHKQTVNAARARGSEIVCMVMVGETVYSATSMSTESTRA